MSENQDMRMFITVDDGSRRVPIMNTSGEEIGAFTFRPTDVDIIRRYNAMVDKFDAIAEPLEAVGVGDGGEVDITDPKYAEALETATGRLYDAVNELIGSEHAAEAFFGNMNPFSPVNGEFYCTGVLNALGTYIGAQFERETAQLSARAKQYAKKAKRK